MGGRERRVYLDHNAGAPLRAQARQALRALLTGSVANPSSVHAEGREARAIVEKARGQVAALLGASASEVVFTSGGSEAIAAAILGVCARAPATRRRLVVSAVEHSAVLESARRAGEMGFETELVACEASGRIAGDAFASRLGEDTALAALQWVNPETGVVQPVAEVGRACAAARVPFLVDAVQAAGKLPLEICVAGASLLAVSSHKIGGPQGAGALVVRTGMPMAPLIPGGAQERRRRGGTEGVLALAGFGAAAEAAAAAVVAESRRLARLGGEIERFLRERYPGVVVHGEGVERVPGTLSFALPGIPGEMLVIALDLAGFALSTGSACASGAIEPSHVLRAMGRSEAEARGAVRVSLGWSSTRAQTRAFLEALPGVVERLRAQIGGRS